jgi:hypothetical protein
MDKLSRYRTVVKEFLQERADLMNAHPVAGLETLCLFDDSRDQYLVLNLGWSDRKRIQYVTLLVRIRNGKVWIEEDGTEEGLASVLVSAGIPKDDIVLAFNPPELRSMTEYAVA